MYIYIYIYTYIHIYFIYITFIHQVYPNPTLRKILDTLLASALGNNGLCGEA